MTLFQESTNQAAFLKMGIFGWTGAGKTYTAAQTAIGLHKYIKSQKPVCFIDTETGSDYVKPMFDKAGVKLMVLKTQAFAQLLGAIDEAEKTSDILLVDSITHFWRELLRSWKEKRNRQFIAIYDFGPLKDEWRPYTTRYVNSKLHFIMCGRAANIFTDVVDEEQSEQKGREVMKSIRSGTKMSAEGETGFEPSLLIEMERVFLEGKGTYVRRATVIKDRFGAPPLGIDSEQFDNPKFVNFLPHIKRLNLGGEHFGVDAESSSVGMLQSPDTSWTEKQHWQKIYSEEIEGELRSFFPGQTAEEKKIRGDLFQVVFDTRSWTRICELSPDALQKGLKEIKYLGRVVSETLPNDRHSDNAIPWLRGELIKMPGETEAT